LVYSQNPDSTTKKGGGWGGGPRKKKTWGKKGEKKRQINELGGLRGKLLAIAFSSSIRLLPYKQPQLTTQKGG